MGCSVVGSVWLLSTSSCEWSLQSSLLLLSLLLNTAAAALVHVGSSALCVAIVVVFAIVVFVVALCIKSLLLPLETLGVVVVSIMDDGVRVQVVKIHYIMMNVRQDIQYIM